jgi:hypothetical protein
VDQRALNKARAAAVYERREADAAQDAVARAEDKLDRAKADVDAAKQAVGEAKDAAKTAEERAKTAAAEAPDDEPVSSNGHAVITAEPAEAQAEKPEN